MKKADCEKWRAKPYINPLTNRTILVEGTVYKKLEKECKQYTKTSQSKASIKNASIKSIKNVPIQLIKNASIKMVSVNKSVHNASTKPIKPIKSTKSKNESKKHCDAWRNDKTINPLTNRKISVHGTVYKKLEKECDASKSNKMPKKQDKKTLNIQHCDEWKRDKTRNPITKRKLSPKNGVYSQLEKICQGSPQIKSATKIYSPKIKTVTKSAIKSVTKSPKQINKEQANQALINAIKKNIEPILHRGENIESRIKFAAIMRTYFKTILPCLHQKKDGKLYIKSTDDSKHIIFDKQIGSVSKYGMAYMNMGKGFSKMLQFSCKIMPVNYNNNNEIVILKKMSNLAETRKCPNMPITYNTLMCTYGCFKLKECPELIKDIPYHIVINELAHADIQTWMKQQHSYEVFESVIVQLVFAIYAFHGMGYVHNDCHLGNFLVHKIKPGGCWRYKINGNDVYVPNHGIQLVMWDPGHAEQMLSIDYKDPGWFIRDYNRPLYLLSIITEADMYINMNVKPPPDTVLQSLITPLASITKNTLTYALEIDMMDAILNHLTSVRIKGGVVVNDKPPTHLLNIKPYTLF